ncbi:MAG: VCBS repeat-containing protein [Bacteroidota bacterium]|nr:VCBS repeat-containing protein [Bacteroidota bacterium]MDP4191094.1 VCBS repeat-containing protein [Bacteroidota bacterium]MDP4195247.1 VCBS repeat-containing protein [Bacteroidota bacterium]
MKYAAITKPYKGEIFAFNHVRNIFFKLIALSLLIAGTYSRAQIPINGFCGFESFKTDQGFSNFIPCNFNGDSYTDLLVFGAGNNNLIVYKGLDGAKFQAVRKNKFRYEISQLALLSDSKNSTSSSLYAFTSRKDRIVGIVKISVSGAVSLICEKKVNSYPDNLVLADIDKDGAKEILVSGGAFNGISSFSVRNGKLVEKVIQTKSVFPNLVIADLNGDGYADIAAYDLLDNSIKFFYNNSIGDFYEVRRIRAEGKISLLLCYDFNLDNIADLIYVCNNQITFLLGDYRAAFNNKTSISTGEQIENLAIGDFNHDGLIDVSYISKDRSTLSVLFAKEQFKFYPEIRYLSQNGLMKLAPFYSKFIHGIVALSNAGEFYLIDQISGLRDNTKISLGTKPSLIRCFDIGNDGVVDLAYIDKAKPSLNLIERNSAGVPSKFYCISLHEDCTGYDIDDHNSKTKSFYCYSKDRKLIEIVSVNFQKKLIKTDKIYSSGAIEDLKIKKRLLGSGEKPAVYVLSKNNGNIKLLCYKYSNFRYTSFSSNPLASNVLQAKLLVDDTVTIFYWKKDKKAFSFNKILINNDLNIQESRAKFVLPFYNNMLIFNFAGDIFNNEKNEALNFVLNPKSNFAIVSSGQSCYRLSLQGSIKELRIQSSEQICSMENKISGLNDLFVYNSKNGSIEKIDLLNKEKYLLGKKIVETKNLESYFVRSLSTNKYHLVYTDKAENCIKIKEIAL